MIVVAALYQFKDWPDYVDFQTPLKDLCKKHEIKGTLLLASEGINGTVAGPREGIDVLKNFLENELGFKKLEYKESFTEKYPFYRSKIRLKKEIVTLRKPEANPNKLVGEYVEPKDWNNLITQPDVVVIDTRNDYEYKIGTFKGALNPETDIFTEFPDYVEDNFDPNKNKRIAMFCTGGIRCEKASAYMLSQGFEEVYHLKGGILKYIEEVPPQDSLWEGECFVFDQRVSVTHGVKDGHFDLCYGCRMPLSDADKTSPLFEEGVSCPHCANSISEDRKKRSRDRQKQINLAKARNQQHMGRSL